MMNCCLGFCLFENIYYYASLELGGGVRISQALIFYTHLSHCQQTPNAYLLHPHQYCRVPFDQNCHRSTFN